MSRDAILWGFLGVGFTAPIDWRLSCATAAIWCLVVALMKWSPDASSCE